MKSQLARFHNFTILRISRVFNIFFRLASQILPSSTESLTLKTKPAKMKSRLTISRVFFIIFWHARFHNITILRISRDFNIFFRLASQILPSSTESLTLRTKPAKRKSQHWPRGPKLITKLAKPKSPTWTTSPSLRTLLAKMTLPSLTTFPKPKIPPGLQTLTPLTRGKI